MVVLLLGLLALSQTGSAPFPDPAEFARRAREALRLDYEIQQNFTYVERRRDVKISRLGKASIGPLRTFEVYPSEEPGRTYKRLIAVDGKPLSPEELARRDAEHRRDLEREAAKRARESPSERAGRLEEEAEERQRREAILDDVVAVFRATFVGRETIDGRRVLVATLEPRENPTPKTREGRWMTHFQGQVKVDEQDYQVVALDMRAVSDITIGWGIVGRLHKGSRLVFERRRFDNAWLPASVTYEASGRTLLFRPFDFAVTTTYSDYRRRSDVRYPVSDARDPASAVRDLVSAVRSAVRCPLTDVRNPLTGQTGDNAFVSPPIRTAATAPCSRKV